MILYPHSVLFPPLRSAVLPAVVGRSPHSHGSSAGRSKNTHFLFVRFFWLWARRDVLHADRLGLSTTSLRALWIDVVFDIFLLCSLQRGLVAFVVDVWGEVDVDSALDMGAICEGVERGLAVPLEEEAVGADSPRVDGRFRWQCSLGGCFGARQSCSIGMGAFSISASCARYGIPEQMGLNGMETPAIASRGPGTVKEILKDEDSDMKQ